MNSVARGEWGQAFRAKKFLLKQVHQLSPRKFSQKKYNPQKVPIDYFQTHLVFAPLHRWYTRVPAKPHPNWVEAEWACVLG